MRAKRGFGRTHMMTVQSARAGPVKKREKNNKQDRGIRGEEGEKGQRD